MSDDQQAPTDPGATAAGGEAGTPADPQPTPVVPPTESSWGTPPGSAAPSSGAAETAERPEIEVGLAFAGGIAAALLLKVMTR